MSSTFRVAVGLLTLLVGTAWACTYRNPWSESINPGHYSGFEWAKEHNVTSCGTQSSRSFIEGCQEYLRQKSECRR